MKLYEVNYVKYDECYDTEVISTLRQWIYQKKENAIAKIAEIKPKIYEKYKDYTEMMFEDIEVVDEPERYSILEYCGMPIGYSVCITEVETED